MNPILDAVGVDAVYIQFYNNYCSVASGSINFGDWDNWAKTVSPNSDVKVFLGVPVSPPAPPAPTDAYRIYRQTPPLPRAATPTRRASSTLPSLRAISIAALVV